MLPVGADVGPGPGHQHWSAYTRRPVGNFYVYENWTNTFAKVHRWSCPHCNDGQGSQGRGNRTPNGQWLGPFETPELGMVEARALANRHSNRAVWIVEPCGYCG